MDAHLSDTMSSSATSLWLDTIHDRGTPRSPLPGDRFVDIAIVGAGYTGLWTAYHLAAGDPTLRIAVVDAEYVGFGASGRNGGWCSALWPAPCPPEMRAALEDAVDEVGRWCTDEGVDADYTKGGSMAFARTAAQERRLRARANSVWLSADEAAAHLRVEGARGAAYDAACAALHPGKLVRGLAHAVERRGVSVYEQTRARALDSGMVDTDRGRLRADIVVRATEGYTTALPRHRRAVAPVYSLVVATEPLPAAFWDEVGWAGREAVTDGRRLIIYAQRTADDRIVFGGRGAPYHFASSIKPGYDRDDGVHAMLRAALRELWPAAADVSFTHAWGGPLGVPRDFRPSVTFDRQAGLAAAGGYVGDGVAASNLAGRTLADLVLGRDSDLVHLPWVGHVSRRWEPEPLRWVGVNAGRWLAGSVDRAENRGRAPRWRGALLDRLTGQT